MLKQNANIEQIGVAIPGTPKQGKATDMINLGIEELDITKILQKKYQGKIVIRNDAKCASLAEKVYGSLIPNEDAVFLCLGTGIGGSVFWQGKILVPKRNSGLELGHMVIEKNGNQCNCGKRGCFETYCAIKRLKIKLIEIMGLPKQIESSELVKIVEQRKNEKIVKTVIEQYIQDLIVGLSNIIDIFEPEAICLGGSFVYFKDVVYELLLKEYEAKKYVFHRENMPELKLAILGNDAGIIGATLE